MDLLSPWKNTVSVVVASPGQDRRSCARDALGCGAGPSLRLSADLSLLAIPPSASSLARRSRRARSGRRRGKTTVLDWLLRHSGWAIFVGADRQEQQETAP